MSIAFSLNDIKHNIDNFGKGGSHIRPAVQNIILNFGKVVLEGTEILEGQVIAQMASEITKNYKSSQSGIWCPLIWNALYKSGYKIIPEKWLKINLTLENKKIFSEVVEKLVNLEGWKEYAIKVLKYKFNLKQLKNNNNFSNKFVINISKKIKNL